MTQINPNIPGRKLAAITAILSLPFAYLTQALFVTSSGGDISIFHNGLQMMALAPERANLFYAAMWTDLLGYYLILLPLLIYAWKLLRPFDEALTDFAFLCGFIYCLLGAFGAVNMAGAFTALHGSEHVEAAASAWEAVIGGNWRGYWLLEAILATIWLGGLARLLHATGFRLLGIGAGLLAVIWLVQFAAQQAAMQGVADGALAIVVLLSPLWAAWLGITLLRVPVSAQVSE